MAGHSKWNNIKRKKEKTDAQKAKIFTKIGREIAIAVRESGADPSGNSKLRELIVKAKGLNVPNENIERIIKKAAGSGDKNEYETVIYEGYGPSGIAVIVEALTDNRNRTASDVRHYFDKFGGNLGTSGCVSFMFSLKGLLFIETGEKDEDSVMEDAIVSGAEDFTVEDGNAELVCAPADISAVRQSMESKGYEVLSAEIVQIPSSFVKLNDEESVKKMNSLLRALEDNDDIGDVWHNWENEEEFDNI